MHSDKENQLDDVDSIIEEAMIYVGKARFDQSHLYLSISRGLVRMGKIEAAKKAIQYLQFTEGLFTFAGLLPISKLSGYFCSARFWSRSGRQKRPEWLRLRPWLPRETSTKGTIELRLVKLRPVFWSQNY